MHLIIPNDIRAEIINSYLGNVKKDISFIGNHNRNAYEDISSITQDENTIRIELSKQSLYDILPESLFHPIDRFDNIPFNEYKERFAEEVEQQRIEEENARAFFSLYDRFIFGLSSIFTEAKQIHYGDNRILSDIICDSLNRELKNNRFISRIIEFTPQCRRIRGDLTKITLMLRKIMADEGLRLIPNNNYQTFTDTKPGYNCHLSNTDDGPDELFLGNTFDEKVLSFNIQYWNDDYCNESFLALVTEIKDFEDFLNDYFMGIETAIHFNISTHTLPVRLSDDMCHNYLDYNTNI